MHPVQDAHADLPPILWTPTRAFVDGAQLSHYADGACEAFDAPAGRDYEALWRWSVADVPRFWRSVADYFEVALGGKTDPTLARADDLASAEWFPGATVSYVEHVWRRASDARPALICKRERHDAYEVSWAELRAQTAALQRVLAEAGVGEGDRVCGFLPNTEHAVVAFLATAGLGAVWSCCSPDFGAEAVRDRFEQIAPKALVGCVGYGYGGKYLDRSGVLTGIANALPTLRLRVAVDIREQPTGARGLGVEWRDWEVVTRGDEKAEPQARRVPFGHPLWILFSSGTTGKPKAIVHGHGGCLLEHLKYLGLQANVREGERFFWFTTTGWMMWNFLQASLLVGAVPVLYDGSPGYPALTRLWDLAAELPIHHFGTSAPFLHACMQKRLDIRSRCDLTALRSIGSTGAPLSQEGFAYVYERIKPDVWLSSMSGGTDVCTAFVGAAPWKPVRRGVVQARGLGCDVCAYDAQGRAVVGEVGELVVRQAMPSMPVSFWGDDARGSRRRASYFEDIPGVWRHGDWVTVDREGGVVIHGRSDATLNRQGVRIGTAEVYRTVEALPEVLDSLIVNYVTAGGADEMPLFVRLADGVDLDESLVARIKQALRAGNSPRHVPTRVEAVADIPYTISGKKLEAPVKRLFLGAQLENVARLGALRNPDALRHFAHLAALDQTGR